MSLQVGALSALEGLTSLGAVLSLLPVDVSIGGWGGVITPFPSTGRAPTKHVANCGWQPRPAHANDVVGAAFGAGLHAMHAGAWLHSKGMED